MFDIKRDMQFPHFCEACLLGIEGTSHDPRYCPECYEFLLKEADNYSKHPGWVPRAAKKPTPKPLQPVRWDIIVLVL